jgi:hypothetical protein
VILGIDHVILAIDRQDHPRISERLRAAGFAHADAGRHVGQGTANENLALAGGAYLELLFPDPPPDPTEAWFDPVPRILGVCFTSSDIDADSAAWEGDEGAWTQDLHKTLDDGTSVHFRLAGPHDRDGVFFVFLLERQQPAFGELGATARLERLTFSGSDAGRWRESFARWLGDGAGAGEVDIRFEETEGSPLTIDATFAVPVGEGELPLAAGRIELRRA